MLAVVVVVALLLLVCGGVAVILPGFSSAGGAARRSQCSNNLKQIVLALHNYHDVYKTFPPAVMTDKQARPSQSWRVAVLPFMEQQSLYQMYDKNLPWDHPKNRAVGNVAVPTYRCPSDANLPPASTSYVMIVGEGTVGNKPNRATKMADIRDGTSNTIAVVEVSGFGIGWTEPKDLTVDELFDLLNNPNNTQRMSQHPGGFNAALADGSVRFIPETVDRETLRRLLLTSDGQPVADF